MSLRRLVQENFWLKLFSVILAVALWYIIRVGIESEPLAVRNPVTNPNLRTAVLPVYVLTDPADGRIFKIFPETVSVSLTGEAAILDKLKSDELKAYVDLTAPGPLQTNLEVRLHAPFVVNVMSVLPRAVEVERISP